MCLCRGCLHPSGGLKFQSLRHCVLTLTSSLLEKKFCLFFSFLIEMYEFFRLIPTILNGFYEFIIHIHTFPLFSIWSILNISYARILMLFSLLLLYEYISYFISDEFNDPNKKYYQFVVKLCGFTNATPSAKHCHAVI